MIVLIIILHPSICCYWRCFDNSSVWSLDWFHSSWVTWRMQRRSRGNIQYYFNIMVGNKDSRAQMEKALELFRLKSFFLPHIACDFIFTLTTQMSILKKYWKNLHHFWRSKGSDLDSDVALIEFSHSHNILLQYLKIGSKIMFSTFYLTLNKMVKWAIDTTFLHWRNLQNWNSFYLSSGRNLCLKFLVLLGLISHPSWQSGK